MDISPEQQIHFLVGRMTREQIDRYMVGSNAAAVLVCEHIAFCTSTSCKRLFKQSEAIHAEAVSRKEARLSRIERWRKEITVREIIHVAKEKGSIR